MIETGKHQAVNVSKGHALGRFCRSTLSWCRSKRISASSEARDRNSPTKAHQSRLQYPSSGGSIVRFGFICQRIGFPTGTGIIPLDFLDELSGKGFSRLKTPKRLNLI